MELAPFQDSVPLIALAIVALFAILIAAILAPVLLLRRRQIDEGHMLNHLVNSDPFARQLRRQATTPSIEVGAIDLLPILAFELYPPALRRIYNASRLADAELLEQLQGAPDDPVLREHLEILHTVNRDIRRRALVLWIEQRANDKSALLELQQLLDENEARYERLEVHRGR